MLDQAPRPLADRAYLGKSGAGEALVGVEGWRADQPGDTAVDGKPWHSSAIRLRVDARTLRTASGSTYVLSGPMWTEPCLAAGFSPQMVDAFSDGFPACWQSAYTLPGEDGKSFAVGCLVRVLREQQRGQVAEVAEVAHGWVKLRLGGQLLSFRPRELEASSGGTEMGAGGRCGEAAAPAGWNGSEARAGARAGRGGGHFQDPSLTCPRHVPQAWSGGELQQLREAHFEISPEAVDFWEQVARRVGRSVQECTAEFYRQHPTPGRQRRRRSSPAPGVPPPPSGLHPDLLQASPWRSGASAADEGEESDGGEGGKVKAKQLKGRATAAFRAGRAPAKRRRSAAAAAEGAAPVACWRGV
ncbi:hypothetical protein EMIHUDRAFT_199568 [Emiliania huxleyi CCMP1516]|uniref:SANTA domain-containing protein n=2 Tax=Emiliania huxleyi TaxID=2903 RepID=A0A0D3KZU5_EMIH1|nr:hypothetical protein EMIHUDRAFT_199568 [Emiliania huxleyi CCMP1516]EOD41280.1 hypothetical protein EMIHUDRAFT_199568 [Emiliania huxleyi CCMP1516]|eukprot:XP_005793709.1 hypothetical protein EMIHUDRAFT_199568 [Emiliania huxleyi CCMP1516]